MRIYIVPVIISALLAVSDIYGQRTADLAIYRIYKPAYVHSSKPSQALFTIINNGPDSVKLKDSIICFFVFNAMQSNLILRRAAMASGDTATITINMGTLPPVSSSGSYQFCINATLLNRSNADSVKENPQNLTNNQDCRSIYVNGLNTGPTISSDPAIVLSPNPASDRLKIHLPSDEFLIQASITDHCGRALRIYDRGSTDHSGTCIEADISELPSGIYYCHLTFVNATSVGKFIISK